MQAIRASRKPRPPRNRIAALIRRWPGAPGIPGPSRIAAIAADWLAGHHIGGPAGKGLRTLLKAYAPAAAPKALSFKLRSIRRLWGSTLTIGIRLKW